MFSLEKVLLSSAYYYRPKPQDQQEFSDPGTYSFVVPAGVERIAAVAVGAGGGGSNSLNGGGGGGGALQYRNSIAVTPGETLTVNVGRGGVAGTVGQTGTASSLYRGGTSLVYAAGGSGAVGSSGGIGGSASSNSSVPIPYAPVGNSALDSVSGVLSLIVGTNVDDTFYEINLPFNISYLGVSYNKVYVGSNAYITFSAGSSIYSGFSPSNPPGPHVLIYPADRRLFQLYSGRLNAGTPNDKFVIRQQGGDYGTTSRVNVWEAHFYPNQNYFDIFFITDPGNNAIRPGISNGTTYLTRYDSTAGSGIRITTVDPTLTNIGGFTGGNGGTGRGGGAGGGGGASGYSAIGGSGGGQGLVSVLGSVFVQSSDFNGTRDTNNTYISINGTRVNHAIGRGHTVAVINPSTLVLESIRTYDTYGQGSDPLYAALNAIPDGKVVAIASFDATSFYGDVREYVNRVFRCSRTETWGSIRRSHIIIGIKNSTTFPVEVIQDSSAGVTGTFNVAGPTQFESGSASTGGGGGGGNAAAFRPRGGGGVGIQGIGNNGNSNGGGGSSYNAVTSSTTAALNSQVDFYPVSLDYAWGNFMNNYAVWSPNGNGDYYRAFYAPMAGVYTIEYSADNYLAFYIDGSLIATTTDFSSSAIVRTTLTIGTKRLRFIAENYGGPAGWAVTIRDPNGTLVWDTRTYRLANSVNNFVRIAAGGTASSGQNGGQYGGGGGGGSAGDPPIDYNEGATARTDRWDNATTYLMSNVSGLGEVLMHGYQPGTRFTFTYNNLPGHNQVRYQVYWHFTDSVDNEYCELTINSEIFAQFRKYLYTDGFSLESSRMAQATWVPASYSYAPWPNATPDGYIAFDTGWINHTSSVFTAGHYNGLNQAQSDEATYLSHVRFQTRSDPSAPGATFEAGAGGNGGVRIIWGAGRSYPYQAQDVTPVRIGSTLQLILHYDAGNLDSYRGGSTVYDISGNNNTGTITIGYQPTTIQYYGNIGVLRFPAWTNTKLDFNANELTNTTITVEMWALVDDFAGGMFFGFSIHDVWTSGGTLGFNTGMGDVYGISAARINALNIRDRWTHYTFVMNVGDYTRNRIYINGVEESLSQQYSYQNTSRANFNSGVGRIGGWLYDNSYQQVMDLAIFKIYNRGLTPAEITTLYNEQRARFTTQLAQTGLLLHLDAANTSSYVGSGTRWFDISGNNNHFDFRGTAVTYRTSNGGNIDLNNDAGSGTFDSYIYGPDEVFRIRTDITVEVWFKLDAAPNVNDWVRIIGKSDGVGSPPSRGRTFGLWYHRGASLFLWQRYGPDSGSGYINAQLSRTVELGAWYHMVGVSNGNTHTLYLNGTPVASQTAAFTADSSTEGVRIGGASFHTLHNGPVAVVRIWNRGLNETEVMGLYNENKTRYIGDYTAGLWARKYSGYFADNVNYFASQSVTESQVASQIANWSSGQDYYSWEFRGFFRAPATGNYWFQIYSDDASYMWINSAASPGGFGVGNAFINHGGLHGPSWSGRPSVYLTAGTYMPVRIQFGENAGRDLITVAITTDSGAWEDTSYGAGYYFHNDSTRNHT